MQPQVCMWRAWRASSQLLQAHACSTIRRPLSSISSGSGSAPGTGPGSCAPVIISGAGPTGLTLALFLSHYGVPSVVLEKAAALTRHPQAHYINHRTMEVMRAMGVGLADAVAQLTPPLPHWRRFVYASSMTADRVLGEVDHFPGASDARTPQHSPEPVAHVPQHKLLPLMLEAARAPNSLTQVLFSHSVTGVKLLPGGAGVEVEVRDESSGGKPLTFRGAALAAADGVHSAIRQQLGVALQQQPGSPLQHLINIHFKSPALGARLLGVHGSSGSSAVPATAAQGKAAMLYFVFNADVVGVVVAHDLRDGEFVAQVPYFPPLQSPSDFPTDVCARLVAAAAGLPLEQLPDLQIMEARPWTMSAMVAAQYVNPHTPFATSSATQPSSASSASSSPTTPRIFLVGDAAHRFPPAGGLGMNTGMQDAHNLAWKLALAVHSGQYGWELGSSGERSGSSSQQGSTGLVSLPHLLSSYEVERRAIAQANARLSIANWGEAVSIPSALGLSPQAADLLNTLVSSAPVPQAAARWLLNAGMAAGRAVTTAPASPLKALQEAKLQQVFKSGHTLRLQFPREDLGFQYTLGALCPEPCSTHGQHATTPTRSSTYTPSSAPGFRLPHVWVVPVGPSGASSAEGHVSTLDIVPGPSGAAPQVHLFVDESEEGKAWAAAAAALREGCKNVLPLVRTVCVLPASAAGDSSSGEAGPADVVVRLAHQDAMEAPSPKAWHEYMGVSEGTAILVRPDGHVAWRSSAGQTGTDKLGLLERAIKEALAGL